MKTPLSEDRDLIAAILAGESDAFQVLVDRYSDRIFRLLSRIAQDHGDVEDLAQEVFVKVYRKLHTFQQDSSLYTWLYRIAINTASDYLARRRSRRLQLVGEAGDLDVVPHASEQSSSLQPLLDQEVRRVTREVLATLPEKYRRILELREFEDMSYIQMSEVLACNIGTVESRLFRARQRFKEALQRLHPELVPQLRGGGK